MSKKDFRMIARILREELPEHPCLSAARCRIIAERFASALAETNPRFDRERFIVAAVGPEGDVPKGDR